MYTLGFFLNLVEILWLFFTFNIMLTVSVFDTAFIVLICISSTLICSGIFFYHEEILNFVKYLFFTLDNPLFSDLRSVCCIYYIFSFVYTKMPLHPWNETKLVMMNPLLPALDCWEILHLCSSGRLPYEYFCAASLSNFGIRVILPYGMDFVALSPLNFQESSQKQLC